MTYRFPLISYLRATVGKHPEAKRFIWLSMGWFVVVGNLIRLGAASGIWLAGKAHPEAGITEVAWHAFALPAFFAIVGLWLIRSYWMPIERQTEGEVKS